MLERARAISLALLGATAAVGLGIVALALSQSWPLLEGSGIPAAPKQEIGSASVVARPSGVAPARAGAAGRRGGGQVGHARSAAPARSHAAVETPSGGEEAAALVVSQEVPASVPPARPPKVPPAQGKSPAPRSPKPQAQAAPSPTAQSPGDAPPPSPPAKAPAAPPEAAPAAPPQPEAIVSEAPPEESNVPSWSNGKGHAYGRDEEGHANGWGDGEH